MGNKWIEEAERRQAAYQKAKAQQQALVEQLELRARAAEAEAKLRAAAEAKNETEASLKKARQRSKPGRDRAQTAINLIWPDGVPSHLENTRICKEVGKALKADNLAPVSDDTILRAANRKR